MMTAVFHRCSPS